MKHKHLNSFVTVLMTLLILINLMPTSLAIASDNMQPAETNLFLNDELQANTTQENEINQATEEQSTVVQPETSQNSPTENINTDITENTQNSETIQTLNTENTVHGEASEVFSPENNQDNSSSQEKNPLEISEIEQETLQLLRAPAYTVSPETKIGKDWTLGDFIYSRNKVIGFSASGLIKVQTQKELILPHLNPETGEIVDTVGENEDPDSWFHDRGLTSVQDYNSNIKVIEGHGSNRISGERSSGVFLNNNISKIDLPNVQSIGSYAFKNNLITKLNFPKLTYIGSHSFADNKITAIEEGDLPEVKMIDDLTFAGNNLPKIYMPKVVSVREGTFYNVGLEDAYFPMLETAGETAFRSNKLKEVTTKNFPNLKFIEYGAFYQNQIMKIEIPNVVRLEDAFIYYNSDINPDREIVLSFDHLTEIGNNGMYGLNLAELNIPNLVKVGTGAFLNNPGVTADVYDGQYTGKVIIWTIDENTVSKENYLINPPKEMQLEGDWKEEDFIWDKDISSKVLGFSPQGLYKYEKRKTDPENPDAGLSLPERATIVGARAFTKIGLTNIQGSNIETIENSAFSFNKLTDINNSFPKLKKIDGIAAFDANQLSSIDLPLLENVPAFTFNRNQIETIKLDKAAEIGDFAFAQYSPAGLGANPGDTNFPVKSLHAPVLKSIGKGAFMHHRIQELNLPAVEYIGPFAFSMPTTNSASSFSQDYSGDYDGKINGYKERTITTLNLPQVKKIDFLAFAGNKIVTANMPCVEEIGRRAFESNNLAKLDILQATIIDAKAFKNNKIDEAFVSAEAKIINNDAFAGNRGKNSTRRETLVILQGHKNPNNLTDGIINGVRQHVINPTKVTVEYVDKEHQSLFEGFTEYILADKVYDAISDVRYIVDQQTKEAKDDRTVQTISFIYDTRPAVENTKGIEIRQENEQAGNTAQRKEEYHIGDTMTTKLYLDLTGIETSYSKGKIDIYYDYRYIEDDSIKVLEKGAKTIKSWNAHNGVIEIELDNISGGYQLRTSIEYKFKKFVTPNHHRMELNAAFINDQEMLSRAEPIYLEGYYNLPSLAKSSPLNLPNYNYNGYSATSNGPRFMGKLGKYVTADNKYAYKVTEAVPVKYNFSVSGLERNIESFVLADTLPSYIAVGEDGAEETKLAVFDPALNPNWVLNEDGTTVTQSKSFKPTTSIYNVADPLYLLFPDLKSGTNVVNEATISLTPFNKGKDETVIENIKSNKLTIYTGKYSNEVDEGDPRFSKEVAGPRYSQGDYRTFFYDIPEDRAKIIPFRLRVSSKAALTDLVDVTMTDYGIDSRLYYYGISFPLEDHTAGNAEATVIAYQKTSEKMNPAADHRLFEKKVIMSKTNNIVFPENIAKSIDYVQIILDKNHKIFSAIEVQVDTKLREPDKAHFIKTGESGSNIYRNYAVMSGNLYQKNTDIAVSKRTDPIKDKKGVTISSYSTDWDNLPGNYFWGEHAEVQIRDYHAQIGFSKKQTYSTARAIEPEETGSYSLSLVPRIYSSNGTSQYGVGLLYDLERFEMIDLMPKGVEITNIILNDEFKESGGNYSLENNYKETGRSAIVFKTEKLNKGVYNIATIQTKIGLDAPEGFITNEAFVTFETEKDTGDQDKIEIYGTKKAPPKLADDPADDRVWLYDCRSIRIIKAHEMVARQYIRKAGDLSWRDDGIVTESQALFDYRLSLINNLYEPRTEVSVVDFFPYIGDVSIQEENIGNANRPARGTEFENTFDTSRNVTLMDSNGEDVTNDYIIEYWNSDQPVDFGKNTNPDLNLKTEANLGVNSGYKVFASRVAGANLLPTGRNNTTSDTSAEQIIDKLKWSENPAENTRAIRVTAKDGVQIGANDKLDIIVPMRAPKNDMENDFSLSGKKAWNSFVRDDDQTIRFVEPNKVYNKLPYPTGSIEFKKFAKEGKNSEIIEPLAGAKFELVRIDEDDTGKEQEEFVANALSDQDGLVKFEIDNILGRYKVREVISDHLTSIKDEKDKYKISDQVYEFDYVTFEKHAEQYRNFDLKISDEQAQEIFLNIKPIYGRIEIEKVNGSDQPMHYIKFALQEKDAKEGEYFKQGETDGNGKLVFENIIEGEYTLLELPVIAGTKVDHDTSYQPIDPIKITIDQDQQEYQFTGDKKLVNENMQLLIKKVAVNNTADLPNNENIFEFTADGKTVLPGFKFKICEVDQPEKVFETDLTDEKGQVMIGGLKANVLYEISEIDKHDEDYATNTTKYRFMINEKTQILDEKGNPFIESAIVFANSKRAEPEIINLPVSKKWLDSNNQVGNRPESIIVRLYADGEKTDQTLILSADHDWRGSFKELKQYKDGKKIDYTIVEENVPARYESQISGNQKDGYQIINRYIPEEPTTTNTTEPTTMPTNSDKKTEPTTVVTTKSQLNTPKTGEPIVFYQYFVLCMIVVVSLIIVRVKKAGQK